MVIKYLYFDCKKENHDNYKWTEEILVNLIIFTKTIYFLILNIRTLLTIIISKYIISRRSSLLTVGGWTSVEVGGGKQNRNYDFFGRMY